MCIRDRAMTPLGKPTWITCASIRPATCAHVRDHASTRDSVHPWIPPCCVAVRCHHKPAIARAAA
eukprot:11300276-Alexandrium_andersonii.AAC.1